jgi:hypothetical protein
MVLLAGAAQQRLIGRLLDQGVLEAIRRLRRQPLLIQEFRVDELLQPSPQGGLVPGRDGVQQLIGKRAPEHSPELRQALHGCQTIQPGHQRVV